MKTQEYLRPKLVGQRFESHSIPLDILRDLAVLDEMVGEVARWKYLLANPDRKRSPRGISQKITLSLTAVEEGSAVAVLAILFAGLFPPEYFVYYEQARDAILSAITAASENTSPMQYLPERALSYFDRLGRSLRDGEAIEFPTANPDGPARLTREVRRRLLLASQEVKEVTEEIELRCAVHEVNQDNMTFQVMLADGSKITGHIAGSQFDNIMDAFKGYKQGVKILLQGVGTFNRNERLQRIESIEHTTLLDPLDIPARFEELKMLQDGWLDGHGRAPSPAGLDWLEGVFTDSYPDALPLPYAYPVAEGGVQFEWPLESKEASLEIDLDRRVGEWHVLDFETRKEEERTLSLEDEASWGWVIERLTEMIGAKQRDR